LLHTSAGFLFGFLFNTDDTDNMFLQNMRALQTTQCYKPEDCTLHSHRCENLKCNIMCPNFRQKALPRRGIGKKLCVSVLCWNPSALWNPTSAWERPAPLHTNTRHHHVTAAIRSPAETAYRAGNKIITKDQKYLVRMCKYPNWL
jgi:hypothetical protein